MEKPIESSKNKGGRPRKESQDYFVPNLQINGLVYSGFEDARRKGEKYDTAIQAAIDKVHFWYPTISISIASVKRILAECRKFSRLEDVFLFRERELEGKELREASERYERFIQLNPEWGRTSNRGSIVRCRVLEAHYGKFPTFPRVNAVD